MPWTHSHSPSAYAAVRHALHDWPRAELLAAIAAYNWQAWQGDAFDIRPANPYYRHATTGALADLVMEQVVVVGLCSNGGWAMFCTWDGDFTVTIPDTDDYEQCATCCT
jgi:hypothetical protein